LAFWWKRYEHILDQKPKAATQALVDVIAKELCELWEAFPPPLSQMDFQDERLSAKWGPKWPQVPRLSPAYVRMLCKVVRLDWGHHNDELEWFLRNDHHRDAAATEIEVELLWLWWPALMEFLHQRKDDCQGHLKRADMITVLDLAETLFQKRALHLN
jgi:hypothetical protein